VTFQEEAEMDAVRFDGHVQNDLALRPVGRALQGAVDRPLGHVVEA